MTLGAETACRALSYDPETGVLRWTSAIHPKRAGKIAGSLHNKGYLRVVIDRHHYYAHRVIWLMMTGGWPQHQIDHRDHNKSNNRWSNLRSATNQQNHFNMPLQRNNKSGIKGVSWSKQAGKWNAYISHGGRRHHIGLFATIDDARVEREKHAIALFGEFAGAA